MQLAQQVDGLACERNHKRVAHLHATRRDAPCRLGSLEVEFGPFGSPQLSRPYEQHRRELERVADRRLPTVGIQRAQQFPYRPWLDNRGVMFRLWWDERAREVPSDVACRSAGGNRVAPHPSREG